jgi:hypothetical protein
MAKASQAPFDRWHIPDQANFINFAAALLAGQRNERIG